MLLPWVVVVGLLFTKHQQTPDTQTAPVTAPHDRTAFHSRPGPWGELQYSRLLIEPPAEFTTEFAAENATPDQPVVWVFKNFSADSLAALWRTVGLSPEQIATLGQPGRTRAGNDAMLVTPPPDLILALSAETRTALYSVLAAFPENSAQHEPFRFRADSAEEWLGDSHLPGETVALVKRLLYRRGTSLLFSDHAVVLPRIGSPAERTQLVKTLARKATLLVKLRVTPASDLGTLSEYWGRGPRRKDVRALLESISHSPQGATIDIAHLMPKFARAHLFTYPEPAAGATAHHDCHWTSLNFFSDQPDERFSDVNVVKQTLENDYAPVTDRPLLGDVLLFTRPDGEVVHSCVFIADDIVFTKNGSSEAMPWILMSLSDVVAFYPADPPLSLRVYRRKTL